MKGMTTLDLASAHELVRLMAKRERLLRRLAKCEAKLRRGPQGTLKQILSCHSPRSFQTSSIRYTSSGYRLAKARAILSANSRISTHAALSVRRLRK